MDYQKQTRHLTQTELDNARSPKGSYNYKQLEVLGVATPPIHGWQKELSSGMYSEQQILDFIALRTKGTHPDWKNPIRATEQTITEVMKFQPSDREVYQQVYRLLPQLTKEEQKEIISVCVELISR